MAIPYSEIFETFSEDDKKDIRAEAARLLEEYDTLQELRKKRALTQTDVAQTLGIRQATVAQMEGRDDIRVSTLASYIQALGGELELVAKFPDGEQIKIAAYKD